MPTYPHAIYCLWEIDKTKTQHSETHGKLWKLTETYGVDQDGYPNTPTVHATGEYSYTNWISKKCWYGKNRKPHYTCPKNRAEFDYDDIHDIPGRAVTVWTHETGIALVALNIPSDLPIWLSPFYKEALTSGRNWIQLIQDGNTLYTGTARATHQLLTEQCNQKPAKNVKTASRKPKKNPPATGPATAAKAKSPPAARKPPPKTNPQKKSSTAAKPSTASKNS